MRNPVSKKLTSINIFFLIFKVFRAGHYYGSNGNISYCRDYRRKATPLFDKIVRKAELLHMVGVRGLEPRASCSQSRRATNCATPRYDIYPNFAHKQAVCEKTNTA